MIKYTKPENLEMVHMAYGEWNKLGSFKIEVILGLNYHLKLEISTSSRNF
jgi:hypothetical protein